MPPGLLLTLMPATPGLQIASSDLSSAVSHGTWYGHPTDIHGGYTHPSVCLCPPTPAISRGSALKEKRCWQTCLLKWWNHPWEQLPYFQSRHRGLSPRGGATSLGAASLAPKLFFLLAPESDVRDRGLYPTEPGETFSWVVSRRGGATSLRAASVATKLFSTMFRKRLRDQGLSSREPGNLQLGGDPAWRSQLFGSCFLGPKSFVLQG